MPGLAAADGLLGAVADRRASGSGSPGSSARSRCRAAATGAATEVQRSAILQRLNALLPPSGPLLNALARFDPFPRIDGPEARRARRRAPAIARDPEVQAAAASVVKVLGTACGLGVEGSGWVAGRGLVVTNAHVVAGQDDTRVLLARPRAGAAGAGGRASTRATTSRCCASTGLDAPALPLAGEPRVGHVGGDPRLPAQRAVRRARRRGSARRGACSPPTPTAAARCERPITSLRGLVRSGNSGGPMVDGAGRVVTTVFAATTQRAARRLRRAERGRARARCAGSAGGAGRRPGPCAGLERAGPLPSRPPWPRPSSSPRSRPSGATSRACCPGAFEKHEGYLEADDHVMTWAVGHLVQLAEPDEYDPKFKKWRMADLPIVPDRVQARRARRALAEADGGDHPAAQARRRRRRSSTPATPAARAS